MTTTPLALGVSLSLSFEGRYEDLVDIAIANGLSWLEFKFDPPFSFESYVDSVDAMRIRRIGQERGIGYSMHAPYYEVNIGSLNDRIREASVDEVLRSVRLAEQLGCRYLTIHGGHIGKEVRREYLQLSQSLTMASLCAINSRCREAGITMCVENRNAASTDASKVGTRPEELAAMCSEIGDDVGITLDIGHANVSGMDPLDFVLRTGPELIRLMHVHDNNGKADQHLPVGSGSIDFVGIASTYKARGWTFPLCAESKTVENALDSIVALRSLMGN